jgi:hypothetical protein
MHNDRFAAKATELVADLRRIHGDEALIGALKKQLIDMDSGACPHARFLDTLIQSLDDLLHIANDPNAYVLLIQGKCPTRPGAMIKKTTTEYAGEVSNDMKVGRDISEVDWEAVCEKCPSAKAWLTIKGALEEDSSCHFYIFNSRENCILKPDSTHCADPSEEEGLYNAHRLNFVAAIHKAFNVKIYYLSIGGVTAMQTIIDNLDQAFFDGTAACYHMSNITR